MTKWDKMIQEVKEEFDNAERQHGKMSSFHHGESVIREEYEELWEQVKKRAADRDKDNMRRECIQIAASALHFITDLLDK